MHQPSATRRTRALAAACVVALSAAVATAAPIATSAMAAEPTAVAGRAERDVTLMLDWVPNPDHVGLYWAKENGLFAKRGLKVALRAPSDPSAPIRLVGVGKADLAVSYEPELFFAAAKRLPVVAVASIVPQPLNSLIALPDSGISSVADLRGRTVGLSGIPTDAAIFKTMLRYAGLAQDDVRTVTVGFSVLPALLSKKVAAIIAYRNVEAVQLAQEIDGKPVVVPADRAGVPAYDELVLVANANRLRSDPKYAAAVRGAVAALVEGSRAARADPARAVELMGRVTEYKAAFLRVSVPETLRLLAPRSGAALGCVDRARWQRYGDWMLATGLLKARVDAAAIVTDAYLPAHCRR